MAWGGKGVKWHDGDACLGSSGMGRHCSAQTGAMSALSRSMLKAAAYLRQPVPISAPHLSPPCPPGRTWQSGGRSARNQGCCCTACRLMRCCGSCGNSMGRERACGQLPGVQFASEPAARCAPMPCHRHHAPTAKQRQCACSHGQRCAESCAHSPATASAAAV